MQRVCGFFDIGMVQRNRFNAVIAHGAIASFSAPQSRPRQMV
jgi:hypothetical protein